MPRLTWSDPQLRTYELGVDRGVFYPFGLSARAWTGLVSVDEGRDGGEVQSYYLDGIKYRDVVSFEDFTPTIECLSYPELLEEYIGFAKYGNLFVGNQRRRAFGFSYRTKVGNEPAGINFAYKVHLVYNLLLTPSGKTYNTVSETVEPLVNSFEGTTVPIPIAGKRPSAHLVVPSSAPQISSLEDILYGTSTTTGRLPLPAEVYTIMGE